MKLIKYNVTNCRYANKQFPSISFNNGSIYLSRLAQIKLKLKEGMRVSLAQNKDALDQWFILIDEEDGFVLRSSKKNSGLFFYSSVLCDAFCKSMGRASGFIRCQINVPNGRIRSSGFAILTSTAEYSPLLKTFQQQ